MYWKITIKNLFYKWNGAFFSLDNVNHIMKLSGSTVNRQDLIKQKRELLQNAFICVDRKETMEYPKAKIARLLIDYFNGDNRRIEHAFAVLKESEILQAKNATVYDDEIVIAAALLHDIGIKVSEEKLGYNNGKTQEEYGPPVAKKLLESIDFPAAKIATVINIISNHHSPSKYDYPELELLKQADRVVNRRESQ